MLFPSGRPTSVALLSFLALPGLVFAQLPPPSESGNSTPQVGVSKKTDTLPGGLLTPQAPLLPAPPGMDLLPQPGEKPVFEPPPDREQKVTAELSDGRPTAPLSMRGAIEMALKNNLDVKFEKVGIDLQKAQLLNAEGAFDPVLQISGQYQSIRRPQDLNNPSTTTEVLQEQALATQFNQNVAAFNSQLLTTQANQLTIQQEQNNINAQLIAQGLTGTNIGQNLNTSQIPLQQITNPVLNNIVVLSQEGASFSASISGRTGIGTRLAVQASMDESLNTFTGDLVKEHPIYEDSVGLQIQQPLLKNFGTDANLADVRAARINTRVQELVWKNNVNNAVGSVMLAYYDMVSALEISRITIDAEAADQKLTSQYEKRVEVGFGSTYETRQASVQLSRDHEVLLAQKSNFLDQQYRLKRLILSSFDLDDPRLFFPDDPHTLDLKKPDRAALLRLAFQNRFDYRAQLLNADILNLRLKFARNQLLPNLDLIATYGTNGLGNGFGPGVTDTFVTEHQQWSVGLQFQYPFGNRQAKAQLHAVVAQKEQAILRIKQAEVAVGVDVDTALSRYQTNVQQLEAARHTRVIDEEAVTQGYRRLTEGLVSAYDLIDQQRKLYEDKSREVAAMSEVSKSIAQLWIATGTILQHNGITFEEPKNLYTPPPPVPGSAPAPSPTPAAKKKR